MIPLETKQSGGKLLPHSDLRGGGREYHAAGNGKKTFLGTWNVRSLYRAGSLTAAAGEFHWGDPDVDGRIILRWIFRKWEGFVGTG
jgi:hypothetical protein